MLFLNYCWVRLSAQMGWQEYDNKHKNKSVLRFSADQTVEMWTNQGCQVMKESALQPHKSQPGESKLKGLTTTVS